MSLGKGLEPWSDGASAELDSKSLLSTSSHPRLWVHQPEEGRTLCDTRQVQAGETCCAQPLSSVTVTSVVSEPGAHTGSLLGQVTTLGNQDADRHPFCVPCPPEGTI